MPSSILRLAPNFIPATRRRLHSQRSTTIFRSAPQKINRTKAEIKSKLCKLQNGGGGKDISKIVGKSQLAKKTNIPINFFLKKAVSDLIISNVANIERNECKLYVPDIASIVTC